MALMYMPVSVSPVLVLLSLAAVLAAAIYWTGQRVPVKGERFLVAVLVAVVLSGAVAQADLILPLCTQVYLEGLCGENWWWCGVLAGCWIW